MTSANFRLFAQVLKITKDDRWFNPLRRYSRQRKLTHVLGPCASTQIQLSGVLEGAAQILESRGSTAKIKSPQRSLTRVLEALRRYSEAGKDDQNKEPSRSPTRASRRCADTRKREKTTKIKSPRGALKRYSEARKVALNKKKTV